ncbi:MAG: DsbA family protein [Bacteroidota bacterium]|nr:DsbA family protein [Bacteroidota bacterium]
MTDELDLNLPTEDATQKKQPVQAPKEGKKQPKKGKKSHRVLWVVLSIFLVFLIVVGVWFYGLVKENIDMILNEDNTTIHDIATNDDPYAGSNDAKIVIVEFSDFQCPYCTQAFSTVREVISTYGDQIKFIYRDFPNSTIHPQSLKAAEAGECASEQNKFWEMHDKIYINTDLSVTALKQYATEVGMDAGQFNECLDSDRYYEEVQQDFASGIVAGVDGTPTFFINGTKFEGSVSVDNFKSIIDELLVIYNQS